MHRLQLMLCSKKKVDEMTFSAFKDILQERLEP